MSTVEWDGPDSDGWTAAATPGGSGVLILRPAGRSWVPAVFSSDGYPLWGGGPCPDREAAQRAAETEVRRWARQHARRRAAAAR